MKKKFFVVIALVLAMAAGLGAVAIAEGPGAGFGHRHGGMFRHMAKELNLSDAQKVQIKTIMQAERAKMQPLRQQLRQNEKAQAGLIGNFDEAQAQAFAQKQAQLMTSLILEKERTKSQIYAVLTPDQKSKAQQLMQERQDRRKERMEKRMQKKSQPTAPPASDK